MTHCTIDRSRCTRDGMCVKACPIGILTLDADGGPEPSPQAEEQCINCGHCAAVCPTEAFSLTKMPTEQLIPLRKDWRLDPERVEQLLKGRRSIRAYRAEPVPREILSQVIEMATYAPSGHNSQPVRWSVIYEAHSVQRIAAATVEWMRETIAAQSPLAEALDMKALVGVWESGTDIVCRGAPHLIIAHGPEALHANGTFGVIATTYLDLAALPFGLGTCWAGFVALGAGFSPLVAQSLGLPAGQKMAGISMVGYPQQDYRRIPARKEPRVLWQ